ncbi:nucleotide exchange factor GrpE [Sporolactobacillus sp. CPB3-1]|uniref:Protein GrpE n=1 Tax=Sporolactobacillus mangiferae TaxID=2940498 RepID=A0ABT0M6G1_9BACL|nr:nucleotide exchange factor GrpE [Sporolactobacillus mangiferae]MCL1630427.1 nucleotide exchange factor GrpE [Sporolactobacillus mangiferae]
MTEKVNQEKAETKEETEELKNAQTSADVDDTENDQSVSDTQEAAEEGQEKKETDSDALLKQIKEQAAQIEALKKETEETKNRWLRTQADFDNFRKRTAKEKADSRKFRAQELVSDMLEILDNFQRALAVETVSEDGKALKKGMEMVLSKLEAALKKEGVEEIPALHEPFDPNVHQAVMQEQSEEHESGIIIQVLQSGYTLNGRVIRPAMVKVSS